MAKADVPLKKRAGKSQKKGKGLHPRNPHRQAYDFDALVKSAPQLASYLSEVSGELRLDFADPLAVKCLNQALLSHHYQIHFWDIPAGYLCPPIPGRADALHYLADLLAVTGQPLRTADDQGHTAKKGIERLVVKPQLDDSQVPKGKNIRVLDIGMGANCVYPMVGHRSYGWRFVGSDIDPVSVSTAKALCDSNRTLKGAIKCRLQDDATHVFQGIIGSDEVFDLTLCNPPFHSSLAEATAGSRRKVKNLTRSAKGGAAKREQVAKPALNFGGQGAELWCEGGEVAFISRMIEESRQFAGQVLWFSSLVSKKDHLSDIYRCLKAVKAQMITTLDMPQGNKQTRIVAWTFHSHEQQVQWRKGHWS